jgi:hypothetical protein
MMEPSVFRIVVLYVAAFAAFVVVAAVVALSPQRCGIERHDRVEVGGMLLAGCQ